MLHNGPPNWCMYVFNTLGYESDYEPMEDEMAEGGMMYDNDMDSGGGGGPRGMAAMPDTEQAGALPNGHAAHPEGANEGGRMAKVSRMRTQFPESWIWADVSVSG